MTSLWICSEDLINLRLNQIYVQVIDIKRDAVIKCNVKEVEPKKNSIKSSRNVRVIKFVLCKITRHVRCRVFVQHV